jgi:hypothetical protein
MSEETLEVEVKCILKASLQLEQVASVQIKGCLVVNPRGSREKAREATKLAAATFKEGFRRGSR